MVAYSFKLRFVPNIQAGLGLPVKRLVKPKLQTIRADRKRHSRPGEEMQLYYGMRTKHCSLIGKPFCTFISEIVLDFGCGWVELRGPTFRHPPFTTLKTSSELDTFAIYDGFGDWGELREFWREENGETRAFYGKLIQWSPHPP